jgi:cytochrome c-type biogenesis protein CcmH/NrfG
MSATVIFVRDREMACAMAQRLSRRLRRHDDAEAWHALGDAFICLGERAAAIIAFRNALRLDDRRLHSRLALGNLLFDSGQCEQAFCCFDLAAAGR